MPFLPQEKTYLSYLNKSFTKPDINRIKDILAQAENLELIPLEDVAYLSMCSSQKKITDLIFESAKRITDKVFGNRVVIFIPLYYSNYCRNNCMYCGYRRDKKIKRKRLTLEEFKEEVKSILNKGFTGIEIVSGEDPYYDIEKIGELIKTAKQLGARALFSNIGVFEEQKDYLVFKDSGLDGWVLFMETYHKESYNKYHPPSTHKASFETRLNSYELAAKASIRTIGLGALLGLYNWKFELLAMIDHARYLKNTYNSIISFSVPRLVPMRGVIEKRPFDVSDDEFLIYIALLRIGFPFASIAISTRERREMRKKALEISGTSTSAESSTSVGGYSKKYTEPQFPNQEITLNDTIDDIFSIGKIPSFCTVCSEIEITPKEFYEFAKSGKLREGCLKNAILSSSEFLKKEIENSHIYYDLREGKIKKS